MVCIVEFNENFRFNFTSNKHKQKIWIDAILLFTKIDLNQLAILCELPAEMLIKVHEGEMYFSPQLAERLAQLFLLTFSE